MPKSLFCIFTLLLLQPSALSAKISEYKIDGIAPTLGSWGVFNQMVGIQWYSENGSPRLSVFEWKDPGKVLIARHGTTLRMKAGYQFADIVQTIRSAGEPGRLSIHYSYEDGRSLDSDAIVQPDGKIVETYVDGAGVRQRNIYSLDAGRKMWIARAKLVDGNWIALGQSARTGVTVEEEQQAAAAKRREAELAQLREEAEQQAQQAARDAARAQEQAENDAISEMQQAQTQAIFQDMNNRTNLAAANAARASAALQTQLARIRASAAQQETDRARAATQARAEATARQQQAQLQARAAAQARAPAVQAIPIQQQPAATPRIFPPQSATQMAAVIPPITKTGSKPPERAALPPVAWKEGVVICRPPESQGGVWLCHGPLQTTRVKFGAGDEATELGNACGNGSNPVHPLGTVGGMRAFGCGFGIHPTDRTYPGNNDPAEGIYVPGRRTYHCTLSTLAYCTTP